MSLRGVFLRNNIIHYGGLRIEDLLKGLEELSPEQKFKDKTKEEWGNDLIWRIVDNV